MAKALKTSQSDYSVLLADDSDDDRALMREALRHFPRLSLDGEAGDGAEVISLLSRICADADRGGNPAPDLLLLDLKMPRKNGYEVLEWLQKQNLKKCSSSSWPVLICPGITKNRSPWARTPIT